MERSRSEEIENRPVEDIPCLLRNSLRSITMFMGPSVDPVLNHLNPGPTLTPYLKSEL
jgi:hypothetical protein